MNDNQFKNDPLLSALNKFAATEPSEAPLPTDIKEGFAGGRKKARIRKYSFRSAFSALVLAITLPALASANMLPAPVKEFVQKVQHATIDPVKHFITNNDDPSEELESDLPAAEFPVDESDQGELKAVEKDSKEKAKQAAKEEKESAKAIKEAEKESDKLVNETEKKEIKTEREIAKEEAKAEKEIAKSVQEANKASAKSEKEPQKEATKPEIESKGQNKK